MIDKLADTLPLWCSQLACLSVGLFMLIVAAGWASRIADDAHRTTRPHMTDAEARVEYQRLYDREYSRGHTRETLAQMEQIVAQQGWDRASHMPGPHPVINGAVGENKLDVIRWRSLWGLGPRDGGNPKYNPKT